MTAPRALPVRPADPGLVLAGVLVLMALAQGRAGAEEIDDGRIVGSHAIVMDRPVGGPTTGMASGPLIGNGDVGVMQSGPAEELCYFIGKNDFWGIRTQAPMPVGQVRLLIPSLRGASFQTVQDLRHGEIRGTYGTADATLSSRAWVDALVNILFVELDNPGGQPIPVTLRWTRGGSAVPVALGAGPRMDGLESTWCPDAPDPAARSVGVASRILGATPSDQPSFTVPAHGRVTIATAIMSDRDAPDGPLAAARRLVTDLTPANLAIRASGHQRWWQEYWRRSLVQIPDKVIEQHWYSSQYVMACCSRAGKTAPGLWGNWITHDRPNWHGDYHLNYNFQAPFYSLYASNHVETALPFYEAMNQSMERGRRIARKRGWQGIHLPVSIGPWGMCPEGDDADWGQRSNAAYAALLFIWHWQYTQDKEWLATTGYAFPRETALFWEGYLKLEGGRYTIHDDSIHEGSGPDVNGLLSLGLVKTLFTHLIPMSEALGVDADHRATWADIRDRISPFPLQTRNGATVFRYTEKGMDWCNGNTLGIQHIFPAGAIGLGSEERLVAISRSMIDAMGRWSDFNGSSSWYTACARVGYDPMRILTGMRAMYDRHSLPNNLLNFGGGGIENVSPSLAVNEMLLQSHDGVLRLFPCWPRAMEARFAGLRTVGAFLVSSAMQDGAIGTVHITSGKGGVCTMANPWPGRSVVVRREGAREVVCTGAMVSFPTAAGDDITLQPGT